MMATKIAIGATTIDGSSGGGINRYTGELLRALLPQDPALVAYTASETVEEELGDRARRVRLRGMSAGDFKGNLLRLLWNQLVLPRALRREGADVFYSTVPEGMLAPPCRQVITIHDVVPLRYPEANPRLRYYYRHVLPRIVNASAAVITVSEATRRDVHRYFRVDGKPVYTIYQGYKVEVFRPVERGLVENAKARYGLDRYVLSVGETRPYKNIRRLVEAFARIPDSATELVVIGTINRLDPGLLELPRMLGIEGRVKFLGYVSDEDLAALYGGAHALVFPSLYEGFGIPPLEAMACGCPVVASRAASIPEVCGDAALYVDPYDTDDIAAAVQRLVSDASVRTALRERGLDRARRFSYATAAEQTLRVLRGDAEQGPT